MKLTLIQLLEALTSKKIELMLHEKGTDFELKSGQYVAIIKETKTKIVVSRRKSDKDLDIYYLRAFSKHLGITSKELKSQLATLPAGEYTVTASEESVTEELKDIKKPKKDTTKKPNKSTKVTTDESSAPSKDKTPKLFELQADKADQYYKGRPAYKVPTDKASGKKVHHWSHIVKTFRGKINQYDTVTTKTVTSVLRDLFSKYVCDEEFVATKCWTYVERKYGVKK